MGTAVQIIVSHRLSCLKERTGVHFFDRSTFASLFVGSVLYCYAECKINQSDNVMSLFSRGPTQLAAAWQYSMQGFRTVWREEAGFRQEACLAIILIPLAVWWGETNVERAMLISACLLVLLVEIINSAIEATIDRFGAENHPLSAAAKDMGSAAVMLSEIMLLVVWVLLLI